MATTNQPAPTQSRHPWRAMFRTVFAAGIALASLAPTIATIGGFDKLGDETALGTVVGQALAVCATVTRILALPGVNDFLRRFLPFLAADPKAEPAAYQPPRMRA